MAVGVTLIAECFWHGNTLSVSIATQEYLTRLPEFCGTNLDIIDFERKHVDLLSCMVGFVDGDMFFYGDGLLRDDLRRHFPEWEDV